MSDDLLWNLLAGEPPGNLGASQPPVSRHSSSIRWHPVQLIALLIFGVCVDAIVRSDRVGIGTSVALAMAGIGVLVRRESRSPTCVVLVGSAITLGCCLTLRSSAWLGAPTLLMSGGLLALAANSEITFTTDRLRDVVRSGFRVLAGPAALWGDLRTRIRPSRLAAAQHSRLTKGLLRGGLLSVPVVAILGGLLASGDRVFAKSLSVTLPAMGPASSHALLFGFGSISLAGYFAAGSTSVSRKAPVDDRSRIGVIEATVILGSVCALYIVFAVIQVLAILAGDDHIKRTTGLTYAEYARSGFFQLLAVSVLTLGVLGLTRYSVGTASRLRRKVIVASEAVVFLTLGIVAVAFRRMSLYEHAYGYTMRRLLPHIVIGVLGMVFVLLALAYGNDLRAVGLRRDQHLDPASHRTAKTWLIPAALTAVVVSLVGANLLNLEAIVARSQLQRSLAGEPSANTEILGLGPDAVPTVVAWLTAHPVGRAAGESELRTEIRQWACPASGQDREQRVSVPNRPVRSAQTGWASFSLSLRNATKAQKACTLGSG